MKPDINNIDEVVKRYLPSAPEERIDSGTTRVLNELRTRPHRASEHATKRSMTTPSVIWKRLAMISAAAAVILAVALAAGFWRNAPAVMEGRNQSVQYDEVVRSSSAGEVLLLADGSRVEMRAKSELLLERAEDGMKVRLNKGSVIVNAAKQRTGHLYVQTNDMTVSVIGTVFFVTAEKEGSRVAVIEGEVRVKQGPAEKSLRPGEQLATNPSMPSTAVKEEISWSRHVEEHIALLHQSPAAAAEPRETFDVVSIRKRESGGGTGERGTAGQGGGTPSGWCSARLRLDPSRFESTNTGVYFLIALAYGLDDSPFPCGIAAKAGVLSGGPEWIKSTTFDIEAVIPEGAPALITKGGIQRGGSNKAIVARTPGPRLRNMVRAMLEDRFRLKLRREMKEMPVYVLSASQSGAKLTPWKEGEWVGSYLGVAGYPGIKNSIAPPKPYDGLLVGGISGGRASTAQLAIQLSQMTGRPILDRTNLPGFFTYEFFFAPADYGRNTGHDQNIHDDPRPPLSSPSLFKVLDDELGLKLIEGRERIEVFVIDSVEKPSEN